MQETCVTPLHVASPHASALWEEFASEFPVRRNVVYLNHAGVSPLCKPAADAMRAYAEEARDYGSLFYERWLACYAELRAEAARLIGAAPEEIAILKNTSEGIATIANGFDWGSRSGPRGRIVAFRAEFPSNWYPWKRLEEAGHEVTWLEHDAPLERIEEAARGAKLLAISYVQYLSGYRADLEAIGEICHRRGVFFFVDAIQGMGVFPLDVRRARVDALAADGHKWMMGPEGCGLLYVRREAQERVIPTEFGWTTVAAFNDYASRDMTLRPDAGRYECGTLNTIGCHGLRASLAFINGIGVERIGAAVKALADRLYEALAASGFEMCGVRTPENGAGIVTFRKPGEDARYTYRRLKEAGFLAAPRQGWLRVSPHFYIPPSDIDRLIGLLNG